MAFPRLYRNTVRKNVKTITAVHAVGTTAPIRIGHCDCRADRHGHRPYSDRQQPQRPWPLSDEEPIQADWQGWLAGGREVERTTDATTACKAGQNSSRPFLRATRLQVTLPVEQMDVTAPTMNAKRAGRANGIHQLAGAEDFCIAALNVAAEPALRQLGESMCAGHQCMPDPPAISLTNSPTTTFASPNSIHVLSEKYSALSMPAKPGFLLRLIANTVRALSASMIGMP